MLIKYMWILSQCFCIHYINQYFYESYIIYSEELKNLSPRLIGLASYMIMCKFPNYLFFCQFCSLIKIGNDNICHADLQETG